MVTVPLVAPDVPALAKDPVVAYMPDLFTRPYPLVPDVAIDIAEQMRWSWTCWRAIHRRCSSSCRSTSASRIRCPPDVPSGARGCARGTATSFGRGPTGFARPWSGSTVSRTGAGVEWAEAFEISEYAAPLDAATRQRLFWFL